MDKRIVVLLIAAAGFIGAADAADISFCWGDTDARYGWHSGPSLNGASKKAIKGWRGETLSAVAEIWSATDTVRNLSYSLSGMKGRGAVMAPDCCGIGYVTFQMADGLGPEGHGCGYRKDHALFDSTMVADCIDHHLKTVDLVPGRVQPLWLSFRIPADAKPGKYSGTLALKSEGRILKKLTLEIEVEQEILPEPSEWAFHLDLWQNPFAVARYDEVPLWSDAHIDAMRPLMKRLAAAGQKVITASIVHKPWNGQVYDPYMSMVSWTKKIDGTWEYGYGVFDRWVEFMMDIGVDRQINCYSMVPWTLAFPYYDEASNTVREIMAKPGEKQYEDLWTGMLTDFAAHLKSKGWFDIAAIAMDERPLDVMQETIKVIRKAEPAFRISLAGNWHPEIEDEIYDYCLAWNQSYPEDIFLRRKAEGKKSTWYTSCADAVPNSYTFSAPGESYRIIMEMIARRSDGFLRWAYNCWPEDPLADSRYDRYASGDCFLVYPGNRSSVRFERLVDGIQQYEKIRLSGRKNLEGKKLVVCGDSFTEGDFTGFTDSMGRDAMKSPEIYDSLSGYYKTYPWWIAKRNGMELVNMAKCGSTLAVPENKKNECFVAERLESVPSDADYIIFKFGINDSWQVPLGSIDDDCPETFCGAWNIVLSWVKKNIPSAKIGVIASNGCKTEDYSIATAAVCAKLGIPCIDEEHDGNIPYFFSQKFKPCPEDIRNERDAKYRVSEKNAHPGIAAHRIESLIVESFLKSL